MARTHFNVPFSTATGTGAEKTLVRLEAPANQRVIFHGLKIGFSGQVVTGDPIQLILRRSSAGGTATSVAAGDLPKLNPSNPESIQTTVDKHFTAEPTTPGDEIETIEIHPQGGMDSPAEIERVIEIPPATYLAVAVNNSGTSVTCSGTVKVEE